MSPRSSHSGGNHARFLLAFMPQPITNRWGNTNRNPRKSPYFQNTKPRRESPTDRHVRHRAPRPPPRLPGPFVFDGDGESLLLCGHLSSRKYRDKGGSNCFVLFSINVLKNLDTLLKHDMRVFPFVWKYKGNQSRDAWKYKASQSRDAKCQARGLKP